MTLIKIHDCDSTNNYALSFRSTKLFSEGLVVISDYQTTGKGQRGSNWISDRGKNLLISIVMEPKISINKQFEISKITSLSILDCLQSLGLKAKIKWPNDILVGTKKISGILIENLISKNLISHSVIGIGLNVNQLKFKNFENTPTSLSLELGNKFDLEEVQNLLLYNFKNRVNSYRKGLSVNSDFNKGLFQKDKVSSFQSGKNIFDGIIRGVNDSGLLIIEIKNEIQEFNIKEIKMLI